MALRTEADLVRALSGTVALSVLYRAAGAAELDARDNGADVIHGTGDTRCRRRVRNTLQAARHSGRARRIDRGTWVPDDSTSQTRFVLVFAGGDVLGEIELVVGDAAALFDELAASGIVIDLALCDPPWGLGRDQTGCASTDGSEWIYSRDSETVVQGYVDTDRAGYPEFTRHWIGATAGLLRRCLAPSVRLSADPRWPGAYRWRPRTES
jgi:hypothetical protein